MRSIGYLIIFLSSALLVIIVLFQNDIRRALTEVGRSSFFAVRE
jgi:hypothetical protein